MGSQVSGIGLFILLGMLCTHGVSHAQNFGGGVNAGVAASEVSGDRAGGPDKLGWYAGVFTYLPFSENSRLQLEISYVQKGSRALRIGEASSFIRDYKLNLHYIEVPLVFQMDFAPLIRLPYVERLTAEFGFSGSTVVGHREKEDGKDISTATAEQKPFRMAELNVLTGLYYPVSEKLSFHLRFSQGITPFRSHQGGSATWYNRGQYHTVWTFGLTYFFLPAEGLLISR